MNERQARAATLLEAFETAEPPHPAWSEADRAWADRVAREAVPVDASVERFVAERAAHALHRLGEREPALVRGLARPAWRSGAVVATVAVAFALGVAADAVGSGRHVDLLAPPFWATIAWNLVVYVLLAGFLARDVLRRGETPPEGVFARAARAIAERAPALSRWSAAGRSDPARRFATLWAARRLPLGSARARALLHASAAALALGLVAGLYARGLVLDYRAVWQSTLLDGPTAHALVTHAFGPASRLSGIPLPDLAAFDAMRVTGEGVPTIARPLPVAGAPAAPWLHLVALTVVLAVVLPRLALLAVSLLVAAWRRRHVALPRDTAYHRRLARLRGSGVPARIAVVPHGGPPTAEAALAVRALLADVFGPSLDLRLLAAVPAGDEDVVPPGLALDTTHAVVLADLAATPEAEVHGRLVAAVARALPVSTPLALVLDQSHFARRFAGLDGRLAERRAAWRRFGESIGLEPLLVSLDGLPVDATADDAPDAEDVQSAFAMPFADGAPRGRTASGAGARSRPSA